MSGPARPQSEDVVVEKGRSAPQISALLREGYASSTTQNHIELTENVLDAENVLPNCPFTVYFHPRYFMPARDVFEALRQADIDANAVSCVQRQSNGPIVLTFR